MELLLATNNAHKKEEISKALPHIKILTPHDLGIKFECDEDGSDYFQNSYKKALTLHNLTQKIVIADDSGLSVDALDGAPGIYSARFGSKQNMLLGDMEKCDLILKLLQNEENRKACFVCNLTLLFSKYNFYSVQETVDGIIGSEKIGENGFGYDPIFYLPNLNKTMAQLTSSEKNAISHRGKAIAKIARLLV